MQMNDQYGRLPGPGILSCRALGPIVGRVWRDGRWKIRFRVVNVFTYCALEEIKFTK